MFVPKEEAKLIDTNKIPTSNDFKGLKIIDIGTNEEARDNYENRRYQFMHSPEDYHEIVGQLAIRGNSKDDCKKRISITSAMTLKKFIDTVKYDPAYPRR